MKLNARTENLEGRRFGRVVVVEASGYVNQFMTWLCVCDCGNKKILFAKYLLFGDTKSCGCLTVDSIRKRSTVHGLSSQPEFRVWIKMRERCFKTYEKAYVNYGGRGITVCKRWLGKYGFRNFYKDMGPRPSPKHTIERINVNGNYSPKNCKWLPKSEQGNNTRRTRHIIYRGNSMTLSQFARLIKIPVVTAWNRIIKRGMTPDQAANWPRGKVFQGLKYLEPP